jgi:sulfite reductase alpha subunit-like flavoprotein
MKVDQLYEKEIEDLLSRGVLHDAFIATSRGGVKRQYVQNELLDQRTLVYWMLEMEKAHVYVCGDALMAHGVRQSLIKILENDQHKSNGQDMLDDLRDEGRYHEDIYGILKS